MPEARCHHMLDSALLTVGKLHLCLLLADTRTLTVFWAQLRPRLFTYAGALTTLWAGFFLALARQLTADIARQLFTYARIAVALFTMVRFKWFTVPLWITDWVLLPDIAV